MAHGHITIYVDGTAAVHGTVETMAETRIMNTVGMSLSFDVFDAIADAIDDDRDHVWMDKTVYTWYIEGVD